MNAYLKSLLFCKSLIGAEFNSFLMMPERKPNFCFAQSSISQASAGFGGMAKMQVAGRALRVSD